MLVLVPICFYFSKRHLTSLVPKRECQPRLVSSPPEPPSEIPEVSTPSSVVRARRLCSIPSAIACTLCAPPAAAPLTAHTARSARPPGDRVTRASADWVSGSRACPSTTLLCLPTALLPGRDRVAGCGPVPPAAQSQGLHPSGPAAALRWVPATQGRRGACSGAGGPRAHLCRSPPACAAPCLQLTVAVCAPTPVALAAAR